MKYSEIIEGYAVQYLDKFWGVIYRDTSGLFGWTDIFNANICIPNEDTTSEFYENSLPDILTWHDDSDYRFNKDIEELDKGKFVKVKLTKTYEVTDLKDKQ